ncbi:MAG: HlyD family efflux transporter periplasmic adaptor subunit [Planctomycetota bacterium]
MSSSSSLPNAASKRRGGPDSAGRSGIRPSTDPDAAPVAARETAASSEIATGSETATDSEIANDSEFASRGGATGATDPVAEERPLRQSELRQSELRQSELRQSELRGESEPRQGLLDDLGDPTRASWWVINWIGPLAIVGLGVAIWFILGEAEPSRLPPPDLTVAGRMAALPPIRTVTVKSLSEFDQPLHLVADGEVVPFREAVVAAEIAGQVVEKSDRCEAGQLVRSGEVLMKIDPTDYELEVERLQRTQEQEYEALREVDQEMVNTTRLIEIAKQDIKLRQREVERQSKLPAGFASERERDDASRALLTARQQLQSLDNQMASQKARRTRLEASERLARTQLKGARVNLQRTEIKAPIDGIIVREQADENSYVTPGTPLVVIETTDKVEVDTKLRNDQLYWVLNQRQSSRSDDSGGYKLPETPAIIEYELSGLENRTYRWKGRLVSYDGIGLDSETRTVPVRILVDQPRVNVDAQGEPLSAGDDASETAATRDRPPALVRGMFVRIRLLVKPSADLVVIPAEALRPGNRVFEFREDASVLEPPRDESEQDDESKATDDADQADGREAGNDLDSGQDNKGDNQGDTGSQDGDNDEGDNEQGGEPKDAVDQPPPFDVTAWLAGKVFIRDNVIPVDSLSVSPTGRFEGSRSGKLWVCEVSGAGLAPDAQLVVSPVGDFAETISVRVPLEKASAK